jgi:hypothetical protein
VGALGAAVSLQRLRSHGKAVGAYPLDLQKAQNLREVVMSDLLDLAFKAHGGFERWNRVKSIQVAASITGAIWFVKSKGDALKNVIMTIETKKERLTTDFPGQDKRSLFEPTRIVMEKTDGTLIEARNDPEKSFEGHQRSLAQ